MNCCETVETRHHFELLLERERSAKQICSDLNHFVDLHPTLTTIIGHLISLAACEAVGLRLEDDGDFPYYVSEGLPESFILKEDSLCAKDEHGQRIRLPDGDGWLLECMCGNIIRGRLDPSLPFFSGGGSFWSNHTSALLAATSEEDRHGRTRNYCNSCGYESVALIPIPIQGERIGLLQLNDRRRGDVYGVPR